MLLFWIYSKTGLFMDWAASNGTVFKTAFYKFEFFCSTWTKIPIKNIVLFLLASLKITDVR